jgi:hypothetical protein
MDSINIIYKDHFLYHYDSDLTYEEIVKQLLEVVEFNAKYVQSTPNGNTDTSNQRSLTTNTRTTTNRHNTTSLGSAREKDHV